MKSDSIDLKLLMLLNSERKAIGLNSLSIDYPSLEIIENNIGGETVLNKAFFFQNYLFFCDEFDFEFLLLDKMGISSSIRETIESTSIDILRHNLLLNKTILLNPKFTHIALKFHCKTMKIWAILTRKALSITDISIEQDFITIIGKINDNRYKLSSLGISSNGHETIRITEESIDLEGDLGFIISFANNFKGLDDCLLDFYICEKQSNSRELQGYRMPLIEIEEKLICKSNDFLYKTSNLTVGSPRPKLEIRNKLKEKVLGLCMTSENLIKDMNFNKKTDFYSRMAIRNTNRGLKNMKKTSVFDEFIGEKQEFKLFPKNSMETENSMKKIPNTPCFTQKTAGNNQFNFIENPLANNNNNNCNLSQNATFYTNNNNNNVNFPEILPISNDFQKFQHENPLDYQQFPHQHQNPVQNIQNAINQQNQGISYDFPRYPQNLQFSSNTYIPPNPPPLFPSYLPTMTPIIDPQPILQTNTTTLNTYNHTNHHPLNNKKRKDNTYANNLLSASLKKTPRHETNSYRKPVKMTNFNEKPLKTPIYELDSSIFTCESNKAKAVEKINELEALFKGKSHKSFNEIYKSSKFCDVILKLKNSDEFMCHKVVLISSSMYFLEILDASHISSEIVRIQMPDWMQKKPFELVIKYMYLLDFQESELEKIDIFLARDILYMSSFLKIQRLIEYIAIKLIIPSMTKDICLDILIESQKRMNSSNSAENVWMLLYRFSLNFFSNHSKSILENPVLRNKLENILLNDSDLLIKMGNIGITKIKDNEHLKTFLAIIVKHNYFGFNIIETLNKIVKNFDNIRLFDRLSLSSSIESLQLPPKDSYYLPCDCILGAGTSDIGLYATILSDTMGMANSAPVDTSSSLIDLFKHVEPDFQADYILPVQDEKKIKSTAGIIVSMVFPSENRRWRTIVYIDSDKSMSIFFSMQNQRKDCFQLDYNSVLFRVSIVDNDIPIKEVFLFHSFCINNDKTYIGRSSLTNLKDHIDSNSLKIRVWVIEYPIHAGCLHYLSSNFIQLVKETDEKKLYEILLSSNVNALNQKKYIDLGIYEAFSLLNSDNLYVDNEKIVAVFLYNYLKGKSQLDIGFLLKTIRFLYLPSKVLLEIARDHKDIRKNLYFQEKLIERFKGNNSGGGRGEKRRAYKERVLEKEEDFMKELMEWLVSSELHEEYIDKFRDLKEKLKEKDEALAVKDETIKKLLIEKQANIIINKKPANNNILQGFELNNNNGIRPPPVHMLNSVTMENIRNVEDQSFLNLNLSNCMIF